MFRQIDSVEKRKFESENNRNSLYDNDIKLILLLQNKFKNYLNIVKIDKGIICDILITIKFMSSSITLSINIYCDDYYLCYAPSYYYLCDQLEGLELWILNVIKLCTINV